MNAKTSRILLLFGACLLALRAGAQQTPVVNEDIDLYLATTGVGSTCGCSNVLIFLDNASYWSNTYTPPFGANTTRFASEIAALNQIIPSLSGSVNVGIMMGVLNGSDSTYPAPNTNSKILGGVVRYALRPMTAANKVSLLAFVNGLSETGDKGSPNPAYALTFDEVYKYFAGEPLFKTRAWDPPASFCTGNCSYYTTKTSGSSYYPPYPSSATTADPYPGGQVRTDNGTLRFGTLGGSLTIGDNGPFVSSATPHQYKSPITAACNKNYIILLSNGQTDSTENGVSGSPTQFTAQAMLNYRGADLTTISLTGATDSIDGTVFGGTPNIANSRVPYYARFLYGTQSLPYQSKIITYALMPWPKSPVTADHDMEILLQATVAQGHGKYFRVANDSSTTVVQTLVTDFNQIFGEIAAVNSVFAAATLPVSANVRGTNLNQIYLGLFRPDVNPRWYGNLKAYQLLVDSASHTLYLADATNQAADNPATGFITPSATSFWTSSSSFWGFRTAAQNGVGLASDSPDGDLVEKGAAAQQLRSSYAASQSARKLYTCTGACAAGSSLSGTPFATSNAGITTANTGTSTSTELQNLISWVRGQDQFDENANGVTTDVRASIHGDVLHSRPAVVNYGRYGNDNDVYVFYGGNDGVFHAIQGAFGNGAGQEAWGFVPSEFFGKLSALRNNSPGISSSSKKPYFFDGSASVYTHDQNNDGKLVPGEGDLAYLYLTAHRGGNLVYALDVSDPTSPKFLWKTTASAYAELGQSWSTVKIAKIKGNTNPVAIFGGGYDATHEDQDPAATDTVGRAIFVADAVTGQLLWQAGPSPTGATYNKQVTAMTFSIPSDVTVYDSDGDGYADRLYVGDTGGNLWRVDIDDPNPGNWTVQKLAAIAGSSAAGKRKFLFAPDVVYQNGMFDAVLLGSGDREHPFNTAVVNRFYMFKDAHAKSTSITTLTEANLYDASSNLVQTGTATQAASATQALAADYGWYITLTTGEKVVSGSTTLAGTTVFNSNTPSASGGSSCTANLGIATQYAVSFSNASATLHLTGLAVLSTADRSETVAGGGFLPTPTPFLIESGTQDFVGTVSGTQVLTLPTKLGPRTRTYWRKVIE